MMWGMGVFGLLVIVVLVLGAAVMLLPFWWMAIASTHTTPELFATPLPWLPGSQLLENLARLQESTAFARYNILVQSGTAMLAQANQAPQSVLKLLQG